jgi:3-isopropylmalate dehydrogenase
MSSDHFKILILPGDGIGPEVIGEAVKIIDVINEKQTLKIDYDFALIGGAALDAHGTPLHDLTLARAREADAILMGAVGGPAWDKVDYALRPEARLLKLRKALDLFANLRPAVVFDALVDASSLKPEIVKGLDILIVRELTGGVYFGEPRGISTLENGEREGVNTQRYKTSEIKRISEIAFELARSRKRHVTSCDKANVMESGKLWREEITKLHHAQYPDLTLNHMYADNCAMQLLRAPKQFDVIVTDNLFGDILSDEAAMLTGSLGMLPSASLGDYTADGLRSALYEPIHGSAPDIAGSNIANPIATILSLAMMFKYSFNRPDLHDALFKAVTTCLDQGARTADLVTPPHKTLSTTEMGDMIAKTLKGLL